MENVERLALLFAGFAGAHGTHGEPTRETGSLKWIIKTTAKTVRKPVTLAMWQAHVKGETPLGVIPIREDCSCSWGSIDFDEYDQDLVKLIARVDAAGFPLVPCRSKSGGLHLFLFLKESAPAGEVQSALRDAAASLGMAESEIFPKQSKILTERNDLGSWMVMPYYGGDFGGKLQMQHGLKKNGADMTLGEFVRAAENKRVALADFVKVCDARRAPKQNGKSSGSGKRGGGGGRGDFTDGPPCLQHLSSSGVQTDGRKRTLFHAAIYFKRSRPEDWKEFVEKHNQTFSPPLPSSEVNTVLRSLEKKDYEYTCKEEPMRSHCDSMQCRLRKFGVGEDGEYPVITSIRKLNIQPPVWFVDIDGKTLELSTDELQTYKLFQKACMDHLSKVFRMMKNDSWLSVVRAAVANLETIEAEEDLGELGELLEQLQEFLTNRARGERREDLLRLQPYEEDGKQYFSLRALEKFLAMETGRGRKIIPSRPKLRSMIRQLGGGSKQFNFGRHSSMNAWWIESSKLQKHPELEPPKLAEED